MGKKARHRILNLFASSIALPVLVLRRILQPFTRIVNFTRAKTKLWSANPTVQFDGKLNVVGTRNIAIGDFTRIGNDVELGTEESGRITIGMHVRINRGTVIFSYAQVGIGDHTLIGEYVAIRDANHGTRLGEPIRGQAHESAPVRVGTDVWIGRGVCILPGVSIGDGCIVGANSVVTKSLPPNTIAVGAPARVIRERR